MKIIVRYLIYIMIFAAIFAASVSESKCDLDITKNKEFILTFLPNYHNNWYSNVERLFRGDSIYIFIYAALPTKGTIEYKDVYGREYIDNFDIPDPKVVYIFKKPAYDYALQGYNLSGVLNDNTHSERVVDFSFKVKADLPVQVYGHSQAVLTSESFNVLPIESLGSNYIVLAYNANVSTINDSGQRTPSQFVIVASEDSTKVTITPSVPTRFNGTAQQNIILNAGQVYLVQSDNIGNDPDLSRTVIKSSKPVAVFSGQQRSRVPFDVVATRASRDYMCEQMPPVESWSNEAVVVPFPAPSRMENSNQAFDKLRIIAAYDNTELYVDNVLMTVLDKAQIYEQNLVNPMHIKATAPIMAAGYKRSSGLNSTSNTSYRGDPLLQIIPTPNQYGESYRFITIQSYEYDEFSGFTNTVYDEHNISVISEPENIQTLLLDGQPLNPIIFKPVEGSSYRYAHIRISEGNHQMTGEKPFGLFVCGYGAANSYGYFCGVVAKRDDYEPPVLQSAIDCFEVEGNVTDQKLKSLTAQANSLNNIQVNVEQFKPYVKEAKFSATLVNKYADGYCKLIAVDSVGQQSALDIDIPGFTVAVISTLKNDEDKNVPLLFDSTGVGETRCYDYTLFNYGKFEQNVKIARFIKNDPKLTIDLPGSFIMTPGQKIDFKICFKTDVSTQITDSLFITGDCATRTILALDLLASKDENEPQVSSSKDPCNQFIDLVISDSLRTDTGIDTIIVNQSDNIIIKLVKISDKSYRLSAKVIELNKDAYIKLTIRDKAGYEKIFEQSLPGFTIDFSLINQLADSSMVFDFGKKMIGIRYCDSVKLSNYGKNEIIFDNVKLSENIWFSVPPSQMPLILQPGDEIKLKVCYWANNIKKEILSDTLNFRYNCIDKQIILTGQPDSLIFGNQSKCDIPLLFDVSEMPKGAFVSSVYPNPSGGIINIDINNTENSDIKIVIFNQLGLQVKNLEFGNLSSGYYKIPVDVSFLDNGYYNYRISVGKTQHFGNFITIK
jgi:hypothetical protein